MPEYSLGTAAPPRLTFWGVRGTRPVSGADRVRYGGDTACVSLDLPGGDLLVLDAGTGLTGLAAALGDRPGGRITLLITHPHLDHLLGFPFFDPIYEPGREIEICGPTSKGVTMREALAGLMDGVRFPVALDRLDARLAYRELAPGRHTLGGVEVDAIRLQHPGTCLGYRVTLVGRSCCYITDNELFPPSAPEHAPTRLDALADLVGGTDLLVIDTTHFDEEYAARAGQGHSAVGQVCDLVRRAAPRRVCLFHHDPDQTDGDIDRKLAVATARLREVGSTAECLAPAQGDILDL